jgi:hypothetical protein
MWRVRYVALTGSEKYVGRGSERVIYGPSRAFRVVHGLTSFRVQPRTHRYVITVLQGCLFLTPETGSFTLE